MNKQQEQRKAQAEAWFAELRDNICAAFEGLEDSLVGENVERFPDLPAGRFVRSAWERPECGGVVMALMH